MHVISKNELKQAYSGEVTSFRTVLLFRREICFMGHLSIFVKGVLVVKLLIFIFFYKFKM